MYEKQTPYCEQSTLPEYTLGDLLHYWQGGLLSDEEVVARWHAYRPTEEQLLQQLIDIAVIPNRTEWWS